MKKNTRFAVLSILVFLILAVAFLADKIVPYDPLSASLSDAFQAPGKNTILEPTRWDGTCSPG